MINGKCSDLRIKNTSPEKYENYSTDDDSINNKDGGRAFSEISQQKPNGQVSDDARNDGADRERDDIVLRNQIMLDDFFELQQPAGGDRRNHQ